MCLLLESSPICDITMTPILLSSSWSLLILFLWFETNAFYEYTKELFKYKTYEEKKSLYDNCSLSEFIGIHYSNFWSKLVSCPYCLGFWTSSVATLVATHSPAWIPMTYFSSLVGYFGIKKLFEKMI
jgi:hypothetical protein